MMRERVCAHVRRMRKSAWKLIVSVMHAFRGPCALHMRLRSVNDAEQHVPKLHGGSLNLVVDDAEVSAIAGNVQTAAALSAMPCIDKGRIV